MKSACAILLSVACPAVQFLSVLAHKRQDFRKKKLNIKSMFRFSLQIVSDIFLIQRRIQQDIFINVHRSSGKVPFIRARF